MNLSHLLSHPSFVFFAVQIVLAYEWLSAGWGKVYGGEFVPNIGKSLARFENGNPHEWYVSSVLGAAKSQPVLFGMLVQWGELLVGVGLLAALALYAFGEQSSLKQTARLIGGAALIGGAFMNLNFYFAAGWTSASTGGFNALMFWVQIVLLVGLVYLPTKIER